MLQLLVNAYVVSVILMLLAFKADLSVIEILQEFSSSCIIQQNFNT